MSINNKAARVAYWLVVFVLFAATTAMLKWYTPVEATMGPIQKIFYLHLSSAINTCLACLVVLIASIGYLQKERMWWDDLALAGAKVAVLMCSVVLITGMVWGKVAWGAWWTWSPRLISALFLWLLYVVYLILRPSIESYQRRAVVSAVYGIAAFLDVPLVILAPRVFPDIHPLVSQMAPKMTLTLAAWFVPVTLLTAGLIVEAFNANRRKSLQRQQASMEPSSSAEAQAAPPS